MTRRRQRIVGSLLILVALGLGAAIGLRHHETSPSPSPLVHSGPGLPQHETQRTEDKPQGVSSPVPRPPRRSSLPRLNRAWARVPEASGFNAVVQQTANLVEFYNHEERNPIWAPAMESAIEHVLTPDKLRELGLQGLTIKDKECRTSTCRLEFEYPLALAQSLPIDPKINKKSTPTSIINTRTEALGGAMYTTATEHENKNGTIFERPTIVVAYDEQTMDPSNISKPPPSAP
jgi:hypothetical protein